MLINGIDLQGTYDMFAQDPYPALTFSGLEDPCAAATLSLSAESNLVLEGVDPDFLANFPGIYLAFRNDSP